MAITAAQRTQLVEVYVAIAGRAPDANGLSYWSDLVSKGMTVPQVVSAMWETDAAKALYPRSLTNEEIVTKFYTNVLGRQPDAEGKAYWVGVLNTNGVQKTLADMIYSVRTYSGTDQAGLDSKALFNNKVAVGEYFAVTAGSNDLDKASSVFATITKDAASADAAIAQLSQIQNTVYLTNGTDTKSGNIFESGLVYNPAGTDRINALQDEDSLTGTGTNPTLNLTLGKKNDNGNSVVTPKLNKIETIKAEFTGDVTTLDLRNSDSIKVLAVNRITADAGNSIKFQNISQPAADLTVQNTSSVEVDVTFEYTDAVLQGTRALNTADSGKVTLSKVNLDDLVVGNNAETEGFEKLELNSSNDVFVDKFKAVDLEELTVKGSGNLSVVDTTTKDELIEYTANGLTIGDGIGIRKIDASAFTGTLNLDITNAVGKNTDPANSGAPFYAVITGGQGNDTFWTNKAITGESATLRDDIDGGTGANTIRSYNDIGEKATIKNIQTLELRKGGQTADLDAFDANLSKVILREEKANGTYTLNSVGKTLAESGNIVLQHAPTAQNGGDNEVKINLKSASGTADTVVVTVENERNKSDTFDYKLTIDSDTASEKVENVTINDKDTETNKVTLTQAAEHVGTVTLTGGEAGDGYTVLGTLVAKTVDAEAQVSNVTLTVGKEDQTIKLGSGNDMVTFDGVDLFTGADKLTDKSGTDTMRAAFSQSVTGAPTITGVEKLHIVATENSTIDMANVTGLNELALMSDKAVDGNGEIFTTGLTGIATSDVITLKNTKLDTINFFGDADGTNADGGDGNTDKDSGAYTQTFNGLTLENNTGATVAVKISAPLQNHVGAEEGAGDGIKNYNLGQLTTHGVTTMSVKVENEYSEDGKTVKAADATTTINNIYDKDLVTFTAEAKGTVKLGTVSGNALGNNIKTFDVSKVGGDFTADVVALGDAAKVTLAVGKNTFSALGSSGKLIDITSFDANDTITGSAQSDTINAGKGDDTINGDRGDNVITAGAGNDVVTAKDGNNTVALGTGLWETVTINDNTGLDGSKSTNVVTLEGSVGLVDIDSNGAAASEVTQVLAVGAGSTLRVDWTGSTLNTSSVLLDGAKLTTEAASVTGDANANIVLSTGVLTTFNGGDGNDVVLGTSTAVGVTFSGGKGNDAFVGLKSVINDVTGGVGADVIVLANDGTKVADTTATMVRVADGDSTASAYDTVYGFSTAAAATNKLDLVFTTIQANTVGTNGTDAGSIKSHAITNGVVTFDDADTFAAAVAVGTGASQLSLTDALTYLATNLQGTSATVGFAYDGNGDGDTTDAVDSFFVFQDGASDTVIQLVGIAAANGANVAAVAAAAGANTVVIG